MKCFEKSNMRMKSDLIITQGNTQNLSDKLIVTRAKNSRFWQIYLAENRFKLEARDDYYYLR